jgi:hypothetical protein
MNFVLKYSIKKDFDDIIISRLPTGGKFVVADQKIAGRNKAHCICIQNKAES